MLRSSILSFLSFSFFFSSSFLAGTVHAAPLCGLVSSSSSASADSAEPSSSANNGTGTNSNSSLIAATWYAGWNSDDYPLSDVSWEKYTHVIYSFAVTTSDDSHVTLESSDAQNVPTFVSLAHENDVKAILSVGGWGGSRFFSTAVGDETNRTAFIESLLSLVSQYSLDGLDFDWEYPNADGIGCNTRSSTDASNFLSFLQALRAEPSGSNLTLSAATSIKPFNGQDGSPLTDVSQFASALDFISIMNYDIWGSWSATAGPNAPLNDTCAPSTAEQQGSAVSAVDAWTTAGFPASQIVLGVASYGHSFSVSTSDALSSSSSSNSSEEGSTTQNQTQTLNLYPEFDATNQPAGDAWDSVEGETDSCGNPTTVGGIFNFWGLVENGFLTSNGTANTDGGMVYTFDECSQTPYVYNPSTQVLVSYDDATSFSAKGQYIRDSGLAGFAMWQAGGDSDDILLDSIRAASGISSDADTDTDED
ncbi:glycoside hydrolase [Sanghuangporus baumii]|uniref:Glycoside hydrolase n=1 Tax=Sanghuangporus baumii TaxID=108892 RepID=A0A9Q5HZW2_SANBA|nr:glycoside hydrolase [Sanghuangporus baumii]